MIALLVILFTIRNFINILVSILSASATNLLYTPFLTTSFFTTLLNLLKSSGIGINLSISNLSTSVFRLPKLVFDAKLEVPMCEIFLISVFVTYLDQF